MVASYHFGAGDVVGISVIDLFHLDDVEVGGHTRGGMAEQEP